jgi:hypothetical protein
MADVKKGDWVRYTDRFCKAATTKTLGLQPWAARRGQVTRVFDGGARCEVNWGDHCREHTTDGTTIEVTAAPSR